MKLDNKKYYLSDEEYKFIFSRVPRLCLDFIVIKKGKVLLAKRSIEPYKGYWSLPGGMVRYKESFDEASVRILKCELGLKPIEKKLIGFMEFPNEVNKNGVPVHSVSIAFLTKLEDGEIIGSDQAHEFQFFDLLPENVHPVQKEFIKKNWQIIKP
jgi:8-oxo-dGTP diphosphatase